MIMHGMGWDGMGWDRMFDLSAAWAGLVKGEGHQRAVKFGW